MRILLGVQMPDIANGEHVIETQKMLLRVIKNLCILYLDELCHKYCHALYLHLYWRKIQNSSA